MAKPPTDRVTEVRLIGCAEMRTFVIRYWSYDADTADAHIGEFIAIWRNVLPGRAVDANATWPDSVVFSESEDRRAKLFMRIRVVGTRTTETADAEMPAGAPVSPAAARPWAARFLDLRGISVLSSPREAGKWVTYLGP